MCLIFPPGKKTRYQTRREWQPLPVFSEQTNVSIMRSHRIVHRLTNLVLFACRRPINERRLDALRRGSDEVIEVRELNGTREAVHVAYVLLEW